MSIPLQEEKCPIFIKKNILKVRPNLRLSNYQTPPTDGEATEVQFGRDVLLPVAEEYLLEHSQEGGLTLQFFVAGEVRSR